MFETFEQTCASAGGQPAMQAVAEAMHVKQRKREDEPVGARNLPASNQIGRVRSEVVVRKHGAFGSSGGAGCVDDSGGRVTIQRDVRAKVGQSGGIAREVGRFPDW